MEAHFQKKTLKFLFEQLFKIGLIYVLQISKSDVKLCRHLNVLLSIIL